MKNYLIALFSGLLFPLGFAPFDIWPLTILSLSLILYLTGKTSLKKAFLVGWIYGIGLWGLGVSWVYVSIYYHGNQGLAGSLIITFVFVSLLSLYTGLVTYLFVKLKTNKELSSNKIIGIKEIKDYIDGKMTLIKTKELIKIKTRQYAKRQFTWARGHMKSWDMIYASNFDDLFRKAINKIS